MQATFNSINSFNVSGDKTAEFLENRRIKLDCGEDGTRYASVVSATFTSNTVVILDEDVVTANLIEVWYSVVKPGLEGNLPDHYHSTTEGDGGYIIPPADPEHTFLELTDTPSTYSGTEGQHLQSTGSGIVWVLGGVDGVDGVDGMDGAGWITASGVPTQGIGSAEDLFLDLITYDIYVKDEPTYGSTDLFIGAEGTASASSIFTETYTADKALDGSTSTFWMANSSVAWWKYEFLERLPVSKLSVLATNQGSAQFKDFEVYGSNNDVDWDLLTSGQFPNLNEFYDIEFSNSTPYSLIRINSLTTWANYAGIDEIKAFQVDDVAWRKTGNISAEAGGGSSTFIELTDTPSTYSGTEGQYPQSTGSGVQWEYIANISSGEDDPTILYPGQVGDFYIATDSDSIYEKSDISGDLVPFKSIVIDIADNWGDTAFLGIRAVDFKREESLIPLADGDITCYATTEFGATYLAKFTFITSTSKTSAWTNTQWLAGNGSVTDQRLICVFDTPIEFDSIVINNSHNGAGYENSGAKNIKIYGSTDEITNTVYDSFVSNKALLFSDQISTHSVPTNTVDDQILSLLLDTSTSWVEVLNTKSNFIELEDTPTTYSGSQYLRTTSSGIEAIDGIIIKSPNESEWLIQVTNSGTLYTTVM